LAALRRKSQTFAYVKYATTLTFFPLLASRFFEQAATIGFYNGFF